MALAFADCERKATAEGKRAAELCCSARVAAILPWRPALPDLSAPAPQRRDETSEGGRVEGEQEREGRRGQCCRVMRQQAGKQARADSGRGDESMTKEIEKIMILVPLHVECEGLGLRA